MNLTELAQRAMDIAGIDPKVNPDAEALVEPLLPIVFKQLALEELGTSLPRKTKTLAFTNGVATLSSDVLTECLDYASLTDPVDNNKRYSLMKEWSDFVRPRTSNIGYFVVNESTITVLEPNAAYAADSGLTGNLSLNTPAVWDIPANATTAIAIRDELLERLVLRLGQAIRGQIANN